jgi:hypothetical protein
MNKHIQQMGVMLCDMWLNPIVVVSFQNITQTLEGGSRKIFLAYVV